MTRPLNSDPLRNFRFQVQINHPVAPLSSTMPRMGFMAVSGLAVQNEVIPYKEGGNNTTTRKMPGQSDFGPISLTRGMMAAPVANTSGGTAGTNEAYLWVTQIFDVLAGQGFGAAGAEFRALVNIDVLAHPVTSGAGASGLPSGAPPIKARFQVYNAWPMGLSYSDLEAGGNAVIIENLTLAHEGWSLIVPSGQGFNDTVPSSATGSGTPGAP